MKLRFIYTFFISCLFLFCNLLMTSYSSGPATQGGNNFTGSPGSVSTCGTCHGNPGSYGGVTTNVSVFEEGTMTAVTEYIPGSTYDIQVMVMHGSGTPVGFGFQCVVLDASNAQIGSFSSAQSNVKFVTIAGGIQVAEHNGSSASSVFGFKWTAPSAFAGAAAGDITFYSAGNAVNGAGTAGDSGSPATGSTTLTEATLPIELISFDGKAENYNTLLTWTTASEIGFYQFEVEYSLNGIEFEEIGKIQSVGNSATIKNYEFVHKLPALERNNYYRLKQVDENGMISYSGVISVYLEKELEEIRVFPVPAEKFVTVILQVTQENNYDLRISDMSGKLVMEKKMRLTEGANLIELQTVSWPIGVYIVQLTNNQEQFVTQIYKF